MIKDFAVMVPLYGEPTRDEHAKLCADLVAQWHAKLAAEGGIAVSEPHVVHRPNPQYGKPVVMHGVVVTEKDGSPLIDNAVAGLFAVGKARKVAA